MFIEHEPQMPSRQERRKVSVGSTTFLIEIDEVGIHVRVLRVVRIPTIDAELAWVPRARRPSPRLTFGDLRVLREPELGD
jgi:hypothetical protein